MPREALGFGVWVLGLGAWALGFGFWGLGFGVWGWGLAFGTFVEASCSSELAQESVCAGGLGFRVEEG